MANDARAWSAERLTAQSMELGDSNSTYRYLLSNGQVITVRQDVYVNVNTSGTWEGCGKPGMHVLDDQGEELGFLVYRRNSDGNLVYVVAYAADDGQKRDDYQWVDIVGEPVEDRHEALAALLNLDHFYLAPTPSATVRYLSTRARVGRIRARGLDTPDKASENSAPGDVPAAR